MAQEQSEQSLAERLATLSPEERTEMLASISDETMEALQWDFDFWARPKQKEPSGDWRFWLIRSGRGFGKNFAAVGWLRKVHKIYPRMAMIARTANDAQEVMLEGESGVLKLTPPHERPSYSPVKKRLTWPNGAVASLFSGEEPEALRGPQCYAFWADELCSWKYAQQCWNNLMFGFRLGTNPRGLITTTPKPIALYKQLLKNPKVFVTRGSSYENYSNLAGAYIDEVIKPYEGTRLGQQEIEGELAEDVPGALWNAELIHTHRLDPILDNARIPQFTRIVIAVDPQTTFNSEEGTETGIVVAAKGEDGHGYVLDDISANTTPDGWARRAIGAFESRKADKIYGEVNQGGDMVESTLRTVSPNIPFDKVHASRGKFTRAEPISALYEQGKVHHIGIFPKLEDQMCSYVPRPNVKSPDRMDALVYAITALDLISPVVTAAEMQLNFPRRESPWSI